MRDNSAAGELYSGVPGWTPGINSLYKITDKLYELKEQLECHLCSVTDDLFNIDNKLMLFDLTNFYFEGSKRNSDKAKFGRSKRKNALTVSYLYLHYVSIKKVLYVILQS